MTTEKTYEELVEYQKVTQKWLGKKKDNENTKLGYAITKKMTKIIEKALKPLAELDEKLFEEMNDARAEFALTDSNTKKFVYDITKDKDGNEVQNYAYTVKGRKDREDKIKNIKKAHLEAGEALLSQKATIETYYATEIPADLTIEEMEAFKGIVIDPGNA